MNVYVIIFTLINNIVNIIIIIIINAFVNNITLVDCIWGEYGEWSTCSAKCGGGTETRTRSEATPASTDGAPCVGPGTETRQCNLHECPGRNTLKDVPKRVLIFKPI